ncbi:L-lactate permease [Streptomyces sp. NBC_00457]|uniref:L-lactate permease n=1 Tax=Streptomyces sp. NBC_00457 TaxID=2975748 RepID=UPI002E1EAC02
MYQQHLLPFAGSLGWSALIAAMPIITLLLLLGVFRTRAWVATFSGLSVSLAIALFVYTMPVGQTALAASQGVAFALFPLAWTFTTAIWIYQMTVDSGHFQVQWRALVRITDDRRIQALLIAFCFGSLLEALAGQGTPVAITTVMLLAVGFSPFRAASTALVANTVPAAFGPLGLPITTLAKVTGLPVDDLGSMAGRQVPVIALFVPLLLVGIVDGRRGLGERWWPALACGLAFALAQFVASNYVSMPLADIAAALAGAGAVIVTARIKVTSPASVPVIAGGAVDLPPPAFTERQRPPHDRTAALRAFAPYLIIVMTFTLSQLPPVKRALEFATVAIDWPGLHLRTASGAPSTLSVFKLNWLSAPGSLLLVSGLLTMMVLRIHPRAACSAYVRTLGQLREAVLCVTGLLGLSFVMNASGQAATLGTWMSGAGPFFAVLAPVLGWLGVALTGSDTSSNSLFGALQATAAQNTGLSPVLVTAANASGGVIGKMISLQNLTIAAGAAGLTGREGDLFRKMLGWSALLLIGMCLLVGLQSTTLLSWMVP